MYNTSTDSRVGLLQQKLEEDSRERLLNLVFIDADLAGVKLLVENDIFVIKYITVQECECIMIYATRDSKKKSGNKDRYVWVKICNDKLHAPDMKTPHKFRLVN